MDVVVENLIFSIPSRELMFEFILLLK